jgi:cytochrome c oxidase assembly protein subunit 15
MKPTTYQPWVFRFAVFTACVALLPIVMGGLVTTMQAGMAFADWPSSDGQGMLTYPWLKSAGDKFLEHGHRLAGMLIGFVSISLAAILWLRENRTWVRWCGVAVLLCVIAQGLLGGQRVLLDDLGLAFLHSGFANLVFAFMAAVALFTSRGWLHASETVAPKNIRRIRTLAAASTAVLFVQYILGGLLRHLGWWPHQHLGFAVVVFVVISLTVWAARTDKQPWIWRPAHWLAILLVVQIALGCGAWVTKFGFGGYLVVDGSLSQVIFRTAHFVVGLLTFMVSVNLLLRTARLCAVGRGSRNNPPVLEKSFVSPGQLGLQGGAR